MAIKFYGGHQLNSKAKVYGTRQDFEVIEVDENGDPITEPSYMPENTNNGSTNWNTIGSNLSDTRSATELTWNIDNSIAPLTAYGTDGWMFQKVSEPSIQLESSYVVSLKVLNATSDLTVRVVKGNTEYGFTPSMVDSLAEQTIPAGDYTNSPQSVSMVVDIGATLGTWNNTLMIQFASAAGYGTFSIQDVLLTDGAQVAPASYYKTLATQYVPPPPMTVGWSNAGLSESERVAPASNGMQLYRHDQPYTNAHSNRTLHNLPEYLEGLPFSVESASPSPENGIQGTTNAFEEYTFNTSGTLYLILRADWGGYIPSTLELQLSDNNIGSTGVSDPSAWTFVEDNVGYMGGGGDYGTLVFSKSVESGTHSLNNLYYYAFKADPAPESAPAPEPAPEPAANWVVVGAIGDDDKGSDSGSVYVYDANDLSAQPTKLTAYDGYAIDNFGHSVAVNSDKIVVAAPKDDDNGSSSGSVYVYDANDLSAQPTKLTAFDSSWKDIFGYSVAATNDKVVVGAYGDSAYGDGDNTGAVYVYDANNLSAQPTKLMAFDGATDDRFGHSVAVSNDKIVVGAFRDDDDASNSGSVYVYDLNDLSAQPTKLTVSDGADFDYFGSSVAVIDDKIIVGAYNNDNVNGSDSGAVYVYDANNLSAQPTKLTAFDGDEGDFFGYSVAASNDKIVVGAWGDDDNGSASGSVYVYDANDLTTQPTKLTAFDGARNDNFGNSVAVMGDKIAVGAAYDDHDAIDSGSVYVYDVNDLSAQPTKLTAFDGHYGAYFGSSVAVG